MVTYSNLTRFILPSYAPREARCDELGDGFLANHGRGGVGGVDADGKVEWGGEGVVQRD